VSETSRIRGANPPPDLPEIRDGPPMLVVLSGPSGSGKDAVRDLLMAWQLPVHFAVTATTRPKRPGEVDGVDYHFVSDHEFDRLEAEHGLIERAIVYGQRKGVPSAEVVEPLKAGRDVIARVDVQGAETLRHLVPDVLLIFIAPPSIEEEARRLQERNTESEEEARLRVETAAREMEAAKRFDYIVVNETGKLEETARRIVEIIASEKRRRAAARA
jgi:guanylate kinase